MTGVLDVDGLAEAHTVALSITRWAVDTIRTTSVGEVTAKRDPADIVTDLDLIIERGVRARLAAVYPDHAVSGEELGDHRGDGPMRWHLDPVDGTTNLANGLPWSSFSLALEDAAGPAVGAVADPWRHEVISAVRGGGTVVGGRVVRCSPAQTLAGTVVLTEWVGHLPWPGMEQFVAGVAAAYGTVRIMGSSALSLAHCAVGRASVAVLGAYHPVDDMAGVLLAREAGAVVRLRSAVLEEGAPILVAAPGVVDTAEQLWIDAR